MSSMRVIKGQPFKRHHNQARELLRDGLSKRHPKQAREFLRDSPSKDTLIKQEGLYGTALQKTP